MLAAEESDFAPGVLETLVLMTLMLCPWGPGDPRANDKGDAGSWLFLWKKGWESTAVGGRKTIDS